MTCDLLERLYLPDGCRRLLCAVSGGADSMCLLQLCCRLRDQGRAEVFAAHYEHGIRGGESERDAAFVECRCRELGVELRLERGDVPARAAESGQSIEEAAREARYDFLERAADEFNCDHILTAHNADDNTETVLFNLARGSGAAGLGGIPRQRGKILRPMLSISRAEIEAYLEENALDHVEDSSNASDDYSRNLIRHRVVPVLRRINPALNTAISRSCTLLRQDEDCLSKLAEGYIKREFDGAALPLASFTALHPAVAGRVLRKLWALGLSAEHVSSALSFARSDGYGLLSLPGGDLRREQGRLYFTADGGQTLPDRELIIGESLELPEAGFRINSCFSVYNGEIHDLFKTYALKYESISGRIFCTSRRPGDAIRPQGRGCTKTLKALFMERGFTQAQRRLCPVLRDDAGIILIPGVAAAERCRPQKGERVLRIEIERI